MKSHSYYVYILTNWEKTVLYVGVTNNISYRLRQHINRVNEHCFSARYKCYYLLYYEFYQYINDAIAREKEIKGWSRAKKEALIKVENKDWNFLNEEVLED